MLKQFYQRVWDNDKHEYIQGLYPEHKPDHLEDTFGFLLWTCNIATFSEPLYGLQHPACSGDWRTGNSTVMN